MKKFVLIMAVAAGLVVAMTGNVWAEQYTACDMERAMAEVEAAIAKVGVMADVWTDAKGVPIRNHVNYLEKNLQIARDAAMVGYSTIYVEEMYDTLTEGAQALLLITNLAQAEAKQTAAPRVEAKAKTQEQVEVARGPQAVAAPIAAQTVKSEPKSTTKPVVEKPQAILASASVKTEVVKPEKEVADPETTAGVELEIEVPATGEVETGELEKILMTIGVASAVGVLGLAGICMIIGRRYSA